MTFDLLKLLGVLGAASVLFACSSSSSGGSTGDICSQQGKCPNEGPPSSSSTQKCEQQISDAKCGGANKAFYQCAFDKEACTSSGFDETTTLANCNAEYQAVKTCYTTAEIPVNGTPSEVPVAFQEHLQRFLPVSP
jgi:hypothetical protein